MYRTTFPLKVTVWPSSVSPRVVEIEFTKSMGGTGFQALPRFRCGTREGVSRVLTGAEATVTKLGQADVTVISSAVRSLRCSR